MLLTKVTFLGTLVPLSRRIKKSLGGATKLDIQGFLRNERERRTRSGKVGVSPATLQLHKINLKSFYRWRAGGELPKSVKWIKGKPGRKDLPVEELLGPNEIREMVEAAANPRDKALVIVLFESAMRLGEFLSLKIKNVSFDKYGAIIILPKNHEGLKTGSRRLRLIDSTPYLQAWINAHPKKGNPEAPLWPSPQGGGLKIVQVQHLVKKYAEKAGVKKHVHPHLFRHSRLTQLAQIYSEMELRELAGWSKTSNMPSIYLHVSGKSLDKKLLEHHGLLEPEEKKEAEAKPLKPLKCPRCETTNPADAKFCYKCSMILTLGAAVELEGKRKHTDDLMRDLLEDPEMQKMMRRKLAKMKTRD